MEPESGTAQAISRWIWSLFFYLRYTRMLSGFARSERHQMTRVIRLKSASKMRNRRTEFDGWKYPSQLQADLAGELQALMQQHRIRYYLEEVPIRLCPGRVMRVDFLVVQLDGQVVWLDAKGVVTDSWALKRDLVKDRYGIVVHTVTRRALNTGAWVQLLNGTDGP